MLSKESSMYVHWKEERKDSRVKKREERKDQLPNVGLPRV